MMRTTFGIAHKTVNTTSFLNHIEHVYKNTGKMLLFLDRAPWHTSKEAREFFKTRDTIVVWYPTGHPYLNPVEEVWNSLKRAVIHSIRYADIDTHCKAVYEFLDKYPFDYNFSKHWRRKPSRGFMRPYVQSDDPPDPRMKQLWVDGIKKHCRCKK